MSVSCIFQVSQQYLQEDIFQIHFDENSEACTAILNTHVDNDLISKVRAKHDDPPQLSSRTLL